MKILYLPKFTKQYKKLPNKIKKLSEIKEIIFRNNPFDPKLKNHKLQGRLNGFCAFSINYQYRIIFDFADDGIVRFYSIGSHKIYDQ